MPVKTYRPLTPSTRYITMASFDEITKDVAGITDKLDTMVNAVEGAVTAPARKAAA